MVVLSEYKMAVLMVALKVLQTVAKMVAMLGDSRAESKVVKMAAMKVAWMASRLAGQ
jgi:hypothetical protein